MTRAAAENRPRAVVGSRARAPPPIFAANRSVPPAAADVRLGTRAVFSIAPHRRGGQYGGQGRVPPPRSGTCRVMLCGNSDWVKPRADQGFHRRLQAFAPRDGGRCVIRKTHDRSFPSRYFAFRLPRATGRVGKKVLIIGAGPEDSRRLSFWLIRGLQVHVVEKQPRVGGRCSSIKAAGFRFDLGPTFFLFPRVLERIFQLVGRDLRREIPMVRLDPQYRIAFGSGGHLDCTPDLPRLEAEIARLSPADAPSVRRFLNDNRAKLEAFQPCLERPFLGWRDLVSWQMLKRFPLLRPWRSLDRELARFFSDPRIRLAFSFQSKYLGMSPFNCPSLFSILSFLEYEFGVWHPIGGCAAVSEGMARIARDLGVTFSLDKEVKELLFDSRRMAV